MQLCQELALRVWKQGPPWRTKARNFLIWYLGVLVNVGTSKVSVSPFWCLSDTKAFLAYYLYVMPPPSFKFDTLDYWIKLKEGLALYLR